MTRIATAASLFDLVWAELVMVLGAPAVAVLLRRSVKRGRQRRPDLDIEGLEIGGGAGAR